MPADALGQLVGQRRDFESHLLGRVAIAQRYRVVFRRLMIDRDTERRAHFVLTAITPSDPTRLIVGGREMPPEHPQPLLGLLRPPPLNQQPIRLVLDLPVTPPP